MIKNFFHTFDSILSTIFSFLPRELPMSCIFGESFGFTKITLIGQLSIALALLFISIVCLLFFLIQRDIINSLLYLILFLASIFFSLFFLGVDYISLLFLIVYIGAVVVLFLFVIFMSNIQKFEVVFKYGFLFWAACIVCMVLFFLLATIAYDSYLGTLSFNASFFEFFQELPNRADLRTLTPDDILNVFFQERLGSISNVNEHLLSLDFGKYRAYARVLQGGSWNNALAYYHADIYLIGFLLYTKYHIFFLFLSYLLFLGLIVIVLIVYNLPIKELSKYKFKYEKNIIYSDIIQQKEIKERVVYAIVVLFILLFYIIKDMRDIPTKWSCLYDLFPITAFVWFCLYTDYVKDYFKSKFSEKSSEENVAEKKLIKPSKEEVSKFDFYWGFPYVVYVFVLIFKHFFFVPVDFLSKLKLFFKKIYFKFLLIYNFLKNNFLKLLVFLDVLVWGYSKERLLEWRVVISKFLRYDFYIFIVVLVFLILVKTSFLFFSGYEYKTSAVFYFFELLFFNFFFL